MVARLRKIRYRPAPTNSTQYQSAHQENNMSDDDEDDVTLEGTLALIKPDAVAKEAHIMERIRSEGFLLVEKSRFRFSKSMAEAFYAPHAEEDYFDDLIEYMTSGDTIALCLARKNGVDHWREVLGPTRVSEAMRRAPNSLRARYGNPSNDMINAVHGSENPESSEREIEIIFPHILQGGEEEEDKVETMLDQSLERQPESNKAYLQKYVCPTLLKGLTEMYATRPDSPIEWLADWLTENNPYRS